MNEVTPCGNQLKIVECLALELRQNVTTKELKIMSELTQDVHKTLAKYNGKMITASELCDSCYLIFIENLVINVECQGSYLVANDLSSTYTLIQQLVNNISS